MASQTTVSPDDPDADDEDDDLSKDVIFEILKNQRRRYVLQYLEMASGPVRLGELAEEVAAWENDTEVSKLSSKQRKRVYVGLYQGHLPKMDDAGVVEFNQDRGIVELTDRAEQLRTYMDRETEEERRWSVYYLGITIPSALVLAGAVAGVPLVDVLPGTVWATIVVFLLSVVACVHAYHETELSSFASRLPDAVPIDRTEQA